MGGTWILGTDGLAAVVEDVGIDALLDDPVQLEVLGVPLYLVYTPDAPNAPTVLSELLTRTEVLAAIRATRSTERI